MFIIILMAGTFISVSANSWFTSWIGLEINLIRIIPLILIKINNQVTESAIKYFIVQAMASIILIFSVTINLTLTENLSLETQEIFILAALTIKTGLPPFHFWFPQVSFALNWWQCLTLFTWQKIAPMLLITSLGLKIIFTVIMLRALTGALGGFNQTFLKPLITYSSISHRGWILVSCSLKVRMWIFYFLTYSFISFAVILFFQINQRFKTNQIFISSDPPLNKNTLILNIFSLGGLPPLLGFTAKIIILTAIVNTKIFTTIIILVVRSVISLFFYTRLIYRNLMVKNKNFMFLNLPTKNTNKLYPTLRVFFNIIFPLAVLIL